MTVNKLILYPNFPYSDHYLKEFERTDLFGLLVSEIPVHGWLALFQTSESDNPVERCGSGDKSSVNSIHKAGRKGAGSRRIL